MKYFTPTPNGQLLRIYFEGWYTLLSWYCYIGIIRLEIFLRNESDEIRIMAMEILHVFQDIYGQNQQ